MCIAAGSSGLTCICRIANESLESGRSKTVEIYSVVTFRFDDRVLPILGRYLVFTFSHAGTARYEQ
jgi:hypothetical protein